VPFRRRAPTVLVVEDDSATRDLYRQALAAAGYKVAAVEDGLDALRRIETDTPDAVVLDLMLPRLGGTDVYQELRALPATRTTPVVVVTGSDVQAPEPSAFQLFLRKPVDAETLLSAIEGLLDSRPAGT
jgi:CheY-like chemotaxis protein